MNWIYGCLNYLWSLLTFNANNESKIGMGLEIK